MMVWIPHHTLNTAFIIDPGVGGFLPAMKQIGNVAALPGIVHVCIILPSLKIKFEKNVMNYLQFYHRNPLDSPMFTRDMGLPLATWQLSTWTTPRPWCLPVRFCLLIISNAKKHLWRVRFVLQVVSVLTSTVASDCWGQTLTKVMSSRWRSSWPSRCLITSQWE